MLPGYEAFGLKSAEPVTEKPVIGILEASAKIALERGTKFGVVTTGDGWIEPLTKANLEILSDDERIKFGGVVATGLGVLDFHGGHEDGKDSTEHVDPEERVGSVARGLVEKERVDVIVLGCAGMEGMDEAVLRGLAGMDKNVHVVDSVTASVQFMAKLLA